MPPPRVTRVLIMRHAEREDEAPHLPSSTLRGWPALHKEDPVLTQRGVTQAEAAAAHVAARLPPGLRVTAVHTSPFVRCAQTAYPLASALRVPLVARRGLGACAWYYRCCCQAGAAPQILPEKALREAFPGVALRCVGGGALVEDEYVDTLAELARACPEGEAVMVVAHREGIRQLDRVTGVQPRMATPYCVVHEYDFECEEGTWTLRDDSAIWTPVLCDEYAKNGGGEERTNRSFAYPEAMEVPVGARAV